MSEPGHNAWQRSIDEALDKEVKKVDVRPAEPELPLKKLWDDELEAELEKAMAGFDADSLDIAVRGRTRSADRANVPKGDRGREQPSGLRTGKVVAVRGHTIFVDLGAKSEGILPLEQFADAVPKIGDTIEFVVDRFDHEEGLLILSKKGAAVEANWKNLRKGLVVEARVVKDIKGGAEVVVDGIRGFMPISQIDDLHVDSVAPFINQKMRVIVTEADERSKNLVVSRRELIERERAEEREKTWQEIAVDQIREGTVRSIKDFGAFVDIGGIDGLIHVSDISWTRGVAVGGLLRVGEKVQVKVLKIDQEKRKVGLGLKQLLPSPWDDIESKYSRGLIVKGKVTRLADFGAFVELEPGIEGLIHVTELADGRARRVKDVVQPEQEVEVRVLKVEADAKRISLTLKPRPELPAAEPEDAEDAPAVPKPPRKVPLKGGLGEREELLIKNRDA